MSTVELVEHLLKIANEVIFPALALWLAYLVRQWLHGRIQAPPYEHKVQIQDGAKQP